MKICERCYNAGDFTPSTKSVQINPSYETFDFCETCFNGLMDYINNREPSEPVIKRRTRKTSLQT